MLQLAGSEMMNGSKRGLGPAHRGVLMQWKPKRDVWLTGETGAKGRVWESSQDCCCMVLGELHHL